MSASPQRAENCGPVRERSAHETRQQTRQIAPENPTNRAGDLAVAQCARALRCRLVWSINHSSFEKCTKIQLTRQEDLTRRIQERLASVGEKQSAVVQ
jgi:hypothetical protein